MHGRGPGPGGGEERPQQSGQHHAQLGLYRGEERRGGRGAEGYGLRYSDSIDWDAIWIFCCLLVVVCLTPVRAHVLLIVIGPPKSRGMEARARI